MNQTKSLKEMEGELIVALIPMFHATKMQRVRLLRVEDAGLWIENQKTNDAILEKVGATGSPKTLIWFFPWHQITTLWGSLDVPALSERAAL